MKLNYFLLIDFDRTFKVKVIIMTMMFKTMVVVDAIEMM
jgi:hypothetical protein